MNVVKRCFFKLFPQFMKSADYSKYLQSKGIKIGKGTHFFAPNLTDVDTQRPWLISIGEYCKITAGVRILCHDYSRSVMRMVYGEIVGEAKETKIGNNVFIGVNSIILMGAQIGDNVIIGAGSVVSGIIPSNVVIAGNPAKIIRTLNEHYENRKNCEENEAMLWIKMFYREYARYPTENEMGPFWQLFLKREQCEMSKKKIFTNLSGDKEEDIVNFFLKTKPKYLNLQQLINKAKE